jgi:cellulose synthase/poly-beta-1,6-N-acetylglucosamine synthase-like glycosyltransferase
MLAASIVVLVVVSLYAAATAVYLGVLLLRPDRARLDRSRRVSVLVAARNEEDKIADTLRSLAAQDYPAELIEFLIGDDDSEDGTAVIIQQFIQGKHNWHYVKITEQVKGQRGKQNVLAQLSARASGELLLVTDADITLQPTWAAALAGALVQGAGMVSGATVVSGPGIFTALQRLDWLMGICIARAHGVMGIPITGVGNNMGVVRSAYDSIGGYAKIPFSITEDYRLFQMLCEKGPHRFEQLYHPTSLNLSRPIVGLRGWLHQRKRWFKGGSEIAWYNRALLTLNGLVMPLLLLGLFFADPTVAWACYGGKIAADFLLLSVAALRLRKASWLLWFPLYEVYYQLMTIIIPINQIIPSKVIWKGRKF